MAKRVIGWSRRRYRRSWWWSNRRLGLPAGWGRPTWCGPALRTQGRFGSSFGMSRSVSSRTCLGGEDLRWSLISPKLG